MKQQEVALLDICYGPCYDITIVVEQTEAREATRGRSIGYMLWSVL